MGESPRIGNSVGADVMRGVAILMVVVYHAFGSFYGWHLPWDGWLRNFSEPRSETLVWFYPVSFGWAGVSLFFTISGFCIHYSYLRAGKFDPGQFYWRRFWRIYPAYLISLVLFAILFGYSHLTYKGMSQILSHAFFIHNFGSEGFFAINPSFWSIATEVQLYLLFPVLLFIRGRLGISATLVILFIVACGWRIIAISNWGLPEHPIDWVWTFPLMTWFDWSLGALVAERSFQGRRAFKNPGLWLPASLLLFVLSTFYKPLTVFSFTLAALASAVALDASLYVRWKSWWAWGLVFIGTISYSLYLWHQPLIPYLINRLKTISGSSFVAWIGLVPLLLVGGWVSFQIFEKPAVAIGHRLRRSRRRADS
ncbi:acyltransferase [Gemmata sp. JC673]|uniref:Acyltransferase n=1 Tax=Gemmata algarum TaxID=2975278 RepID=A0ABU5F474_9BACT|nr:acyltransferase [Gemmata algarum]MDY3561938.1 acyltransferase [Gemmata algarum]